MKTKLLPSIIISTLFFTFISCKNNSTPNESVALGKSNMRIDTNSTTTTNESENLFDDPDKLTVALSQNGIGELEKWRNPMEMGWGSLTYYYSFGNKKDGVGMQNNLCYYLEGTETKVTKMYINLNINNPSEKKKALQFLNEITKKTFATLEVTMPTQLTNAILNSKPYKTEIGNFKISNELQKSKIDVWKVNFERK